MNGMLRIGAICGSILVMGLISCQNKKNEMAINLQNDSVAILNINRSSKFLLLPIQEGAPESKVCIMTGISENAEMDVRIAQDRIDYYVPMSLPASSSQKIAVRIRSGQARQLQMDSMKLSNTFDVSNREKYRPLYHHTPLYGWMNDPNGMVYKDGEYHLFYQYNPYGSMWGNMHWGHSVSRDLVNWEHLPVAIERDSMGHIFSGSSIVDFNNSAGFGKGAIISFYTSASGNGQVQCMAYSTDNGRTFTKYDKNPVLKPIDGIKDFRDPKVLWYEPDQKWVMLVSAFKEMRFYSSTDLKEWTFMSAFGDGYGVKPSMFECPDFFQLPVDGDVDHKKWALIVNVNPGCIFGGSATQYFVGDFDGKQFTCDTKPEVVKWLDWGKDHYATVTFSNTGNRVIAVPWMSNWQYANVVPTLQFRSANGLPRELTMYKEGKDVYLAANPVKEVEKLRVDSAKIDNFEYEQGHSMDANVHNDSGAYEIDLILEQGNASVAGFKLKNVKGEYVDIYINTKDGKVYMDRTNSGMTNFSQKEFAIATWAKLHERNAHSFQIFVDKSSIEMFVDGGKIAMTNLVFPSIPYNNIEFHAEGGKAAVKNMTVYKLNAIK